MAYTKSFICAKMRQALLKSQKAFELQQKAVLLQSEAMAIEALFTPEEIGAAVTELNSTDEKLGISHAKPD